MVTSACWRTSGELAEAAGVGAATAGACATGGLWVNIRIANRINAAAAIAAAAVYRESQLIFPAAGLATNGGLGVSTTGGLTPGRIGAAPVGASTFSGTGKPAGSAGKGVDLMMVGAVCARCNSCWTRG